MKLGESLDITLAFYISSVTEGWGAVALLDDSHCNTTAAGVEGWSA